MFVDDFSDVTPTLLHTAYVEAMYRVDEFEFERLQQSFWNNVIFNVSRTRSASHMIDKFPMRAEDQSFTRPLESFYCGAKGEKCGLNTKRIPKKMC